MKLFLKNVYTAVQIFIDRQLITMSAALAYYAIFALPPLLLIILTSTKKLYFWGTTENYIFDELQSLIGIEATTLLRNSMQEIANFDNSTFGLIISISLIVFSSTSVFVIIQNGFNKIFEVKANPGVWTSILIYVLNRLLSLGILIGFAFLMVVNLVFHMGITFLSRQLFHSTFSSTITDIMGAFVLPLIFLTLFFGIMFKTLPDVNLKFQHVWPGAIFTSILFVIGKYAIGAYIGNSSFNNTYASASSLIVILLWSYYSSVLILLGCTFLKAHLDAKGIILSPSSFAEFDDDCTTKNDRQTP